MFYQTDKPRENHARIVRALELCSDIYRDIIVSQIAPEDLKTRAEGRTQFYKGLMRDEKQNIKNASRRQTLEDLDLSILYKILRNVCLIPAPKSGWGSLKIPSPDVELADDIERIRLIRNETSGHSAQFQVEDAAFSIFWNELSLVVERMDRRNSKHYTGSLEEILHCSMNAQVEAIKRITKDVQCLFNNTFHCRIDRIADEVQRRLWENNCIILTGIGGCGKTSIAKQAVKELSNKISTKDIFFVNTVTEFSSVIGLGNLQVVLIDDPFGKSNLNKSEFDSWQKHFSRIEALVKSKKHFLLLTCRKSIFESVRVFTDRYEIFDMKNTLDLSTKWKFTSAEKKNFLYDSVRYFNIEVCNSDPYQLGPWDPDYGWFRKRTEFTIQNLLEEGKITSLLINSISKTDPRIGFPLACHLFFSTRDVFKQGLDFFVKADESLVEEINSVRARCPEDYAILVYVLLQWDHEIDIEGRYDKKLIEKICQILEIMKLSPVKIYDKVEFNLSSSYLQKKRSGSHIYTFQHESLFENVLLSFCQFFAQEFLELAPFHTIRHFIRPSFHKTQPGEICYILSPKLDSYLVCLYGENIIENKAPIDDLWIICEFLEENLQFLLNRLNERGMDYLYQKTKNTGRRFRVCNDALRKYLPLKKSTTLIKVVLTMFPDVIFEYISFKGTLFYENTPRKAMCRAILDCTFSLLLLKFKNLSNETCMTGLVQLLLRMSDSYFKDVSFDVMKGMDNLITEIRRLSCQKTVILFWSVVIKEFRGKCDYQIDMCEILIEKACKFLSFDELMSVGDVELWKCLDAVIQKKRTVFGKRILKFIRRIPGTALYESIMTEELSSAVFVCTLDHVLNLVSETMTNKFKKGDSCVDFMKEDPFVNLSKLCKRLPNVITFWTIKSSINLGAVELLRLFLFYESITDIPLPAISEWQKNDGEGNSLKELLEKDDCMVMFGLIQKNPQIITHETVRVAIEIGAINSLKVILSYTNEKDSQHSVIQKILDTKMFAKFDGHVKVLKTLLDRDDFDLFKMINRHDTDNSHIVRRAISTACQQYLCWDDSLNKDNAEVMSLFITEIPEIITCETVQAAIKTGAVNSLKIILTTERGLLAMETFRETRGKGTQMAIPYRFLKKDDVKAMRLLVSKIPQFITYGTVQTAIEAGAVNSLKFILSTQKDMKNGLVVTQARRVPLQNCFIIFWNNFLEKDDVEIMSLLVRQIPQIITYRTVQVAIETNAVKSLKLILTSEKVTDYKYLEMTALNIKWTNNYPPARVTLFDDNSLRDWSRFLEKDDVEILSLLATEIPEIITCRTIQAAIDVGAVNLLKVILTTEIVIEAIRKDWKESAYEPLFANDDDEEMISSLSWKKFSQNRKQKTGQKVIEKCAVISGQLNLTAKLETYIRQKAIHETGEKLREENALIHWNKLLEKDDVEIMSLFIMKIPQIITDGTVEAAIKTGAVNSLKVILSTGRKKEKLQRVMKAILKTFEMDAFLYWNILLQKDDVELLQMLVKEIPQIITYRTVQAAIETGAVNSLRLILTTEKETGHSHKIIEAILETGEKGPLIYWNKLLEQDDVEIMSLIIGKIPQIVTYRTIQAAIETGAVNSFNLL